MKKLLLTAAVVVLLPFTASAFDLGDAKKLVKGYDCNVKAASIVAEGGKEVLNLYKELQHGHGVDAGSKDLIADLKVYIKEGCAEDHLKKALAAVAN